MEKLLLLSCVSNIITYKVSENGNYESLEKGYYISVITNISRKNELIKY